MAVPMFSDKELVAVGTLPASPLMPEINEYCYPVTPRDAVKAAFSRHPVWQLIGIETQRFAPYIFPDNIARALVVESRPFDWDREGGGNDMFGVEWEYVPVAMGSMVKSDLQLFDDANSWPEKVTFPDVDAWDWEGSAQANNDTFLDTDRYNQCWIQTGWFERLVSFMGFEDAAVAMIDEDQQDAVKALFDKISDLYIDIIDHFVNHYEHIDGFYIHDDWGSSQNSFFSEDVCREMIVPAMRKVTDHLHELGLFAELHSCGCNIKLVPCMIEAGWDAWCPQADVNDVEEIYEKYGDKILIAVPPRRFDPETTPEEEQRAIAREYVAKYCDPEKPSMFCQFYDYGFQLTPAFWEELYKGSRKRYSE